MGADYRALHADSSFPLWRIHGVLEYPEFYTQFVEATGHPNLTIRWSSALEATHMSFSEGCHTLLEKALHWHQEHGVRSGGHPQSEFSDELLEEFWDALALRPALFMGASSGWDLYCFLSGLTRGGDWLGLPTVPIHSAVFHQISERSTTAYGSSFAAFRFYSNASSLLRWAGHPRVEPDSTEGDNKAVDTDA